jgi:hypothetical protein
MSNEQTAKKAQDQPELLTPDERQVCQQIAAGEAPHSQRALALLALDQRVTQAEAGQLSGLTEGQVRYWRDKFRQRRLSIFPENQLGQAEPGSNSTPPETHPEQARQPKLAKSPSPTPLEKPEEVEDKLQPVEAVEKEKKAKKAQKAKGGKGQVEAKGKKNSKKKRKEGQKAKKTKKAKGRKRRVSAKAGKKSKKQRKAKKAKKGKGGKGK